jgi:peptide methionine sulfoxide reductase MsrA
LENSKVYSNPIVTTFEAYTKFFAAEDYHQGYFLENGHNPYCEMVVRPKVEKFKKLFSTSLK